MSLGLIGRKCGMTRVFKEDGESEPITVLQVDTHRVAQVKTPETDGYFAVQVAVGEKKSSKITKPMAGHYAKAGVTAGRGLWEFRVNDQEAEGLRPGSELTVGLFEAGQYVDAQAISIGKGFAGVIKRHNFSAQDATHGNSLSHRAPGSNGQNQTPGRVFKGKRMAGHMGAVLRTVHNLKIHAIDKERNLLLVRGAVPGPKGGDVRIVPAVKKKGRS